MNKKEGMGMILFWKLVIMFFIFSVAGWAMEVTLKYIQYHRFINRGFLIGPYCPVYGWGVVLLTVIAGGVMMREGTVGEMFLAGFVVCGALEYATSFYLEKVFHARWWDYSQKPMNLHGRIWIGNLILFGIGSVIIANWIDPIYFHYIGQLEERTIMILGVLILILYGSDSIASHFLMGLVKKEIDSNEKDNTEEISREIHLMLQDRNLLVRRITAAYPDWQAKPAHLTRELKEKRRAYREAMRYLKRLEKIAIKRRIYDVGSNIGDRLEDLSMSIYGELRELELAGQEGTDELDAALCERFRDKKKDDLTVIAEDLAMSPEEAIKWKIRKARLKIHQAEVALRDIEGRLSYKKN